MWSPKPLDELTGWQRFLLIILIVLIILFAMAAFGYFTGGWDEARGEPVEPRLYEGIPIDSTLLRLDKRALEEAYHAQLLKLFGVWLSQGAPEDAKNIQNGLRIARRAYNQAATQISKREQQLLEEDRRQQDQLK